jgi:cell division protein FtsN
MAEKQSTSPWVWIFLILMLASFAAFILFLDQKIVKSNVDVPTQKQSSGSETNKPIIDFYDILPQREMEIPISEKDQEGIKNPSINKDVEQNFVLQVGSFHSAEEADSLKAELAFLGLQARVKTAEVEDETWHRVQLGPFGSNTKLSRAKNLLIENNIKYMQRSQ